MRSPRRWHTHDGYHPSPQQRYLGAQKPKKRAKVLLFFDMTKDLLKKSVKNDYYEFLCVFLARFLYE